MKKKRCLTTIVLFLYSGFILQAQFCFNPALNYNNVTGSSAVLCAADFNNDGKIDFATSQASGISLILQNNIGGFDSAMNILPLTFSSALCAADFNNDGKMDLASHNNGPSEISILLGNGTGTFSVVPSTFATGIFLNDDLCSADFNNDGKMDLAISTGFYKVLVWLGNGDGTFGAKTTITTSSYISKQLISADFNNDGKADLATSNMVLLGDGTGGFVSASVYGINNTAVVSDDFNGDGKADIACNASSSSAAKGFNLYLGDGLGGFGSGVFFSLGDSAVTINPSRNLLCSSDFDGDGKKDIATGNLKVNSGVYSSYVSLFKGNGAGSFATPLDFPVSDYPRAVAGKLINNDNLPDLVVSSSNSTGSSQLNILYHCFASSVTDETNDINSLKLFPNPCFGEYTLTNSDPMDDVILYDLSGHMIAHDTPHQTTMTYHINLPGIYFVCVASNDQRSMHKLVVLK